MSRVELTDPSGYIRASRPTENLKFLQLHLPSSLSVNNSFSSRIFHSPSTFNLFRNQVRGTTSGTGATGGAEAGNVSAEQGGCWDSNSVRMRSSMDLHPLRI